MGRPITHTLPSGIYSRFTVVAGLQAGVGDKGAVRFSVIGDGRELAFAEITGTNCARRMECGIAGVTHLQLLATGLPAGNAKSNYAVWVEPRLLK